MIYHSYRTSWSPLAGGGLPVAGLRILLELDALDLGVGRVGVLAVVEFFQQLNSLLGMGMKSWRALLSTLVFSYFHRLLEEIHVKVVLNFESCFEP